MPDFSDDYKEVDYNHEDYEVSRATCYHKVGSVP